MPLFHSKVRDPKHPSIADFLGLKRPFDADDAAVAGPSVEPDSKKVKVYSYPKSWEDQYPWLFYEEDNKVAFCRTCRWFAESGKKWMSKYAKDTFSTEGWGELLQVRIAKRIPG